MSKPINANVINVIDDFTIVIDKGSDDGLTIRSTFFVFNKGEEFFGINKESLGILELVCGRAVVKHLQDKMCTIISNEYIIKESKTIKNPRSVWSDVKSEEIIEPVKERLPFDDVKIGSSCRAYTS